MWGYNREIPLKMPPSIKKLKKRVQKEDDDMFWLNQFARKFSIYMTWFFLHIKGITPSQVTLLGLLVGVMAAGFFATGDYYFGLFGAFLVFLGFCLDNVDGEIARYKKLSSIEGHHFDALTGHIVDILFVFGIALGSFIETGSLLVLIMGVVVAASFSIYDVLVNVRYATFNYYSYHYKTKLVKKKNKKVELQKKVINTTKSNLLMKLIHVFSKFMFLFQVAFRFKLIFFLALIGKLEYFVYFYAIAHPLFLIANIIYQHYGGLMNFFNRVEHYVATGEVTSFEDS